MEADSSYVRCDKQWAPFTKNHVNGLRPPAPTGIGRTGTGTETNIAPKSGYIPDMQCRGMVVTMLAFLLASSLAQPALLRSQSQASDIRTELADIELRQFRTLDDYLSRCERVRTLLPALVAFHKQAALTIKSFREGQKHNPQLLKMADFYAALNEEDRDGLDLLHREMDLSLEMSKLPSIRRQAFFDRNIRPLEQREDAIGQEEVQMAIAAKKAGMPLPDVGKSIGR